MPACESAAAVILAAALGALTALTAAVIPGVDAQQAMTSIMDDQRLRLICVAGSLGGAVLSVGLFNTRTVRDLSIKLSCSSISGVIFAPMALRWLGWAADTDAVLCTSGITALMSWSVLQTAVPALTRLAGKKIDGSSGL
jgi:hypothetical protein